MNMIAATQKRVIEMLIDGNPTPITISRTTYVTENGARKAVTSTHGPFDIGIYSNVLRTAPKTIIALTDGVKLEKIEWSALAKADADIQSGSNVVDTFTIEGQGIFKVETAIDIQTMKEVTGKLLLLEMIR